MSTPTPGDGGSGPSGSGGSGPNGDRQQQQPDDQQRGTGSGETQDRAGQQRDGQPKDTRPPWERDGQPFDPERAWKQLQGLREERDRARSDRDSLRGKVDEHERSQMSETQRLEADRDAHRQRADTAQAELVALRAALQHGVPADDLDDFLELLGTGTAAELTARAEKLATRFAAPARTGPPSPRPSPRAGERRSGGGDPTQEPDERDLNKLADRMFNR